MLVSLFSLNSCYYISRYSNYQETPICIQERRASEAYDKCKDKYGNDKFCKDKYDDYMDLKVRCNESLNDQERSSLSDVPDRYQPIKK
jgi:hypothetical protein